jgi:hypothetical protein
MPALPSWVRNAVSGQDEPPDLDWLINLLHPLAPSDPQLVVIRAYKIFGAHMQLRGRPDRSGLKITGTKRLHAKRVKANRGVAEDLERLLKVARGVSDKRWQTAWLGVSGEARSAITKQLKQRRLGERNRFDASGLRHYGGRGFSGVMPTQAEAVPLIEGAIRDLERVPAKERSERRSDPIEDAFVSAVCEAHRKLTGRSGYTWNSKDEKFEHGLHELCRSIDRRFGTNLFTVDRVKKIFSQLRKQDKEPATQGLL